MYYAVARGNTKGVFDNWTDCKQSVQGYSNAIFKKFTTLEEANQFIDEHTTPSVNNESQPDYYVYTDGACSKNGTSHASAGIGIYFSPNDSRNVSMRLSGKQTNNAAELTAIIKAIQIVENDVRNGKCVAIVTDSEYSIRCATTYGEKCAKKQWKDDIPNQDLVRELYEVYSQTSTIKFIHIKAHTRLMDIHSIGNREADKLACEGVTKYS